MTVIKGDQRPLYLQVIDQLKTEIEAYDEGAKLPTEFEWAKQLGVSRATLREALRILEEDSLVIRRHGVGTFVHTKPLFSAGMEELASVTDMITKANMVPGTIFLSSSLKEATKDERQRFDISETMNVLHIERVRTADGAPIVYCLDMIPEVFLSNHSIHETKSLFQFLEETGRTISYAVTEIEPIGYHDEVTQLLDCPPETSLLLLKQLHYDQADEAVLYSLNYFRADKFKFHVVRRRE